MTEMNKLATEDGLLRHRSAGYAGQAEMTYIGHRERQNKNISNHILMGFSVLSVFILCVLCGEVFAAEEWKENEH